MRRLLILVLRGYKLVISPWFGQTCRFYPSCSSYAIDAVSVHGVFRGSWLTIRRLGRCHPWNPGGVDHVPGSEGERRSASYQDEDGDGPSDETTPTDSSSATPLRSYAGARPSQGA